MSSKLQKLEADIPELAKQLATLQTKVAASADALAKLEAARNLTRPRPQRHRVVSKGDPASDGDLASQLASLPYDERNAMLVKLARTIATKERTP